MILLFILSTHNRGGVGEGMEEAQQSMATRMQNQINFFTPNN